jgi:hypothetical protein
MRHLGTSNYEISSEPIEGEPFHTKDISTHSPSMPTPNVSSESIPNLRGEIMSISAITMTYPILVENLNYHEKKERMV